MDALSPAQPETLGQEIRLQERFAGPKRSRRRPNGHNTAENGAAFFTNASGVICWPPWACQVSGLWQYWQRSAQPCKNTTVRIPGPSTVPMDSIECKNPVICLLLGLKASFSSQKATKKGRTSRQLMPRRSAIKQDHTSCGKPHGSVSHMIWLYGYHCFFVLSSTRMQIFSKKEHHMAFFFPNDLLEIIL